jgi:uncharacterized protein YkwD
MRYIFTLVVLVSILSCEKKTESIPSKEIPKVELSYQEQTLLLVNNLRIKGTTCGTKIMPPVSKVVLSDKLNEVALAHSKDMDTKNYFSHTNKEGKSPRDRIRAAGYQDITYGENIYQSSLADAEWAVGAWQASSGHCLNMMDANFKEMGIGNHNSYWTQIFASKK